MVEGPDGLIRNPELTMTTARLARHDFPKPAVSPTGSVADTY